MCKVITERGRRVDGGKKKISKNLNTEISFIWCKSTTTHLFRIMSHVANLFPLNVNFYFQRTQDEHKPRESDPGGDGRT